MTLQSSGAISLDNIQTEFGGANPISLSEYYAGGSYVPSGTGSIPSSGAISMGTFYGTASYTGYWVFNNSMSSSATAQEGFFGVPAYTWYNNRDTGDVYFMGPSAASSNDTSVLKLTYKGISSIQFQTANMKSGGGVGVDAYGGVYLCTRYAYISTNDLAIAYYNSSGTPQWGKYIRWSNTGFFTNPARFISVDSSYAYIAGHAENPTYAKNNGYIMKYNQYGTRQLAKTIRNSSNQYTQIYALSNSGSDICVIGTDSTTTASNNPAGFIAKFNYTDLSLAWAKKLTMGNYGNFYLSDSDTSNNVYAFGQYNDTSSGYAVSIVAKYNSSGVIQWQRTISYSAAYVNAVGISADYSSGAIYLLFGIYLNGANQAFIAKYNTSGVIQWQRNLVAQTIGGQAWIFNPQGITVAESGNKIMISGQRYRTGSSPDRDGVVIKLPTDGSKTGNFSLYTYSVSTGLVDAAGGGTDVDYTSSVTVSDGSSVLTETAMTTLPTSSTVSATNTTTGF